jgi:hypothetical protein
MRLSLALCCLLLPQPALAQSSSAAPPTELDAFMEKVLAQREKNRITLQRYVLDEVEGLEVIGPGRMPLHRQRREFTWYVRDGLHVRSPVRFDGVTVDEKARDAYEHDWTEREKARLERQKKKDAEGSKQPAPENESQLGPAGATPIPTPRFVSEAYFMDFKFEPGNYYLAGREKLEGQDVLRIEYYPTNFFRDSDPEAVKKKDRGQEYEEKMMRRLNKTALITLWVDPAEHQIVKYTFANVWMDFLPGAWLVKVDEIRASMTMGQPFPGVWLPREMKVNAGVTLANGSFDGIYGRTFSEYKLADVTTKFRIPKAPPPIPENEPDTPGSGPFVPESVETQETIAEIRVHGNAFVPDQDVIRLAGVGPGQPINDEVIAAIEQRLKQSGKFESVEVRKRYRSLTNTAEVAVLLIVHERPGVTSVTEDVNPIAGTWRRIRNRFMFLPILNYSDGYGFTYGARVSTVNLLGMGERLSVPLSWGGTRRAAVEIERTFESGPLTRLSSSFGIWQRENPHYELDDQRLEWRGRAERHFAGLLRAGVEGTTSTVEFGALDDRLWTVGADVALDLRADPSFPRNAVYLGTGWTGLNVRGQDARINRYFTDARGYLGVVGQAVLAGRVQYTAADSPLPIYERLLLGGSSTLRGFRTGTFTGDRMFVTSAEVRVPITSVLSGARLGVHGFFDAAKAYDIGERFGDVEWHRAAGAGVFVIASVVRINLDVAHGFRTGDTRVHLGMGFPF